MRYEQEDNYLDKVITDKLVSGQENREPSGKLSAGKLYWPLQWQILATQFGLKSNIDDYTLRKFQRGHDVEDWFVKQIEPKDKQKFLEYLGVIGYCDSIVDTEKWDNPVGVIPLEVKSVANSKFKWISSRGADKGHILQNSLYALAFQSDYHAITYIASDDYRIITKIYKTRETKKEVDKIIDEFEEALKQETIPVFEPREDWQGNLKYNNFPEFAGLSAQELKEKYIQLKNGNL